MDLYEMLSGEQRETVCDIQSTYFETINVNDAAKRAIITLKI